MSQILDIEKLPDDGRPLLGIDVDGVLNAATNHFKPRVYDLHTVHIGRASFTVLFNKRLAGWLEKLTDHFIPVWCTMWDDEANLYLSPLLGLPSLPFIPCGHLHIQDDLTWRGQEVHHKVKCIEPLIGKRAFAWIDDEIDMWPGTRAWADHRADEVAPTRLVRTNEREGLLGHHVSQLIDWAEGIK